AARQGLAAAGGAVARPRAAAGGGGGGAARADRDAARGILAGGVAPDPGAAAPSAHGRAAGPTAAGEAAGGAGAPGRGVAGQPGVPEPVLERRKAALLRRLEREAAGEAARPSGVWAEAFKRHYLLGEGTLLSAEQELELARELLPAITPEAMAEAAKFWRRRE